VYSVTCQNNASISNLEGGFRRQVNILGALHRSKVNITVFKKIEKNEKKVMEKREFFYKTRFRPNRFFNMVVTQKLITVYT